MANYWSCIRGLVAARSDTASWVIDAARSLFDFSKPSFFRTALVFGSNGGSTSSSPSQSATICFSASLSALLNVRLSSLLAIGDLLFRDACKRDRAKSDRYTRHIETSDAQSRDFIIAEFLLLKHAQR